MDFEDFKYESPNLYRLAVGGGITAVVIFALALFPDGEFARASGIRHMQIKTGALKSALYWETRAMFHPSDVSVPEVGFGFLQGIEYDARVVASVPVDSAYVMKRYQLADIKVTNLVGTANMLAALRTTDATLNVYGDRVVVWIDEKPLNVTMIESGLAVPDPNPPTNIVDKAFAAYYWRIFNGASNG
ncbi:hypothetical protein [Duganella sp. LjRoot269]|uniref:hypothetical protein n=1 Tax=Duganella sp. LjRoot269 TaxID=3342305 RepID=UPI003ECDB885